MCLEHLPGTRNTLPPSKTTTARTSTYMHTVQSSYTFLNMRMSSFVTQRQSHHQCINVGVPCKMASEIYYPSKKLHVSHRLTTTTVITPLLPLPQQSDIPKGMGEIHLKSSAAPAHWLTIGTYCSFRYVFEYRLVALPIFSQGRKRSQITPIMTSSDALM